MGQVKIAKCTWDPVVDADGYNVYLKLGGSFVKHNSELITGTQYYIGDLDPDEYEAKATSVQEGLESQPSDVKTFIIEVPVVPLCQAEGMAMTTDFYTMEKDYNTDEMWIHKRQLDGAILSTIAINWGYPDSYVSSVRFLGFNHDETQFYLLHTQVGVISYDANGDFVAEYDPDDYLMDRDPDSHVATVARDGRIAVWHTNSWDEDGLQVLNPDLSLAHSQTFYRWPQTDGDPARPNSVRFDGCGNLVINTNNQVIILDSNYEEIFSVGNDGLLGRTIVSVGMNDEKLYAFGFRIDDQIPVAILDLNTFEHEIIGHIDLPGNLSSSASAHALSAVVDKYNVCWLTANAGEVDGEDWTALIRVGPEGNYHVWQKFIPGGQPVVPMTYTYPGHKLLGALDRMSFGDNLGYVRVVDLDAMDEASNTPAIITDLANETRAAAHWAPGEFTVLKGITD